MSVGNVTDFGQEAPGLMKLFGVDRGLLGAEIQKRSDKMLAAAGIPTDTKTAVDMPETLKGRGIREWELYTLDNPAADAARLTQVAQTLLTEAEKTGNASLKAEAYEAMAASNARLFEAQALQNVGKPYNPVDLKRSVSILTASLAAANGVADKGEWQGDSYTTGRMEMKQSGVLAGTADFLAEVGNQAQTAGVNPTAIHMAQQKAIRENRTLIFVDQSNSDDPFCVTRWNLSVW